MTKLRADGSALIFSTYLGGGESEVATSVALDSAANVYITGTSGSLDFRRRRHSSRTRPTSSTPSWRRSAPTAPTCCTRPIWVASWSTPARQSLSILPATRHVTGVTRSEDFPVVNPLQSEPTSQFEAFFAKISDFDLCLQDERQGHTLQIDLSTGGYQFSGCGGASEATLIGRGRYHTAGRVRAAAGSGRIRAVQQPVERGNRHGIRPRRGILHHRGR